MAAARAVRRARRRRVMWAMTALLALAAGALALWPTSNRYRASAVVQVGPADAQGLPVTTLEYDAQKVTRPDTVSRIVDSVLRSEVLRAHLTATASSLGVATRRVRDAAELVRATAAATSAHPGAQADAKAALANAEADLARKHAQSVSAALDVATWMASTGNPEPPRRLADTKKAYEDAVRGGTAAAVTNTKRAYDQAKAQYARYQQLNAKAEAARSDESSAQDARDAARSHLEETSSAPPTVTMSPVQQETIAQGRSPGRLSLAAIMLVLAIAAADAIFLTRVKVPRQLPEATRAPARVPPPLPPLAPEHASAPAPEPARTNTPEPSTVPLPEPVVRPVPQPASAAVPNRRRYPRRRRERVAASPLDLPNIEVHLLDREGGLRSIQLRNAAGTQATKAQHQREQ